MFLDRTDAGRQLGVRLDDLRADHIVVLGLPRGGVPVAFEVAKRLGAPLDVLVVRKLRTPGQPELALGAIGEEGVLVLDAELVTQSDITADELEQLQRAEQAQLERRLHRLRSGRDRVDLAGRTAVVVDDGVATGSTARAACAVARRLAAAKVVLAIPVAPARTLRQFPEAEEVVCLATPDPFRAVSSHYRDFAATPEDEVVRLLARR